MNDPYFIDTKKFSLERFRGILKSKELLPGRAILKEHIDDRFQVLFSKGLTSLYDLLEAIKTTSRIEKFSESTGLSKDYLTILRREAGSYISAPVRLKDFPLCESDIISKLEGSGIKDSRDLFSAAFSKKERAVLAKKLEISSEKLLELVVLCDLVRISGIGPVFARIIYDAGFRSANHFLHSPADKTCQLLIKLNSEKGYTKSKFTLKDIEYCQELGADLPMVLEV